MKRRLIYLLLLPVLFALGCERNPDPKKITFSLQPEFNNSEGATISALPSSFVCYALFVHFASDTDGSHCLNSNTSELIDISSAFGPFQANETGTFTITEDDIGGSFDSEEMRVQLMASQNQADCDAAESQNDLREMLGTNLASASIDTFTIVPGENSFTYTIGAMLSDQFSNCQGVNNVSEL